MPRLGRSWARPRERNSLWSLHFPELSRQALSLVASHFTLIHPHLGLCPSVCVRDQEPGSCDGSTTGQGFRGWTATWTHTQQLTCSSKILGKTVAEMPPWCPDLPPRWASRISWGHRKDERTTKSAQKNSCLLSQTLHRYFLSVDSVWALGHKSRWNKRGSSPLLTPSYHPAASPCQVFSMTEFMYLDPFHQRGFMKYQTKCGLILVPLSDFSLKHLQELEQWILCQSLKQSLRSSHCSCTHQVLNKCWNCA